MSKYGERVGAELRKIVKEVSCWSVISEVSTHRNFQAEFWPWNEPQQYSQLNITHLKID